MCQSNKHQAPKYTFNALILRTFFFLSAFHFFLGFLYVFNSTLNHMHQTYTENNISIIIIIVQTHREKNTHTKIANKRAKTNMRHLSFDHVSIQWWCVCVCVQMALSDWCWRQWTTRKKNSSRSHLAWFEIKRFSFSYLPYFVCLFVCRVYFLIWWNVNKSNTRKPMRAKSQVK